ncbi:GldG family protein [Leptolyngbya sp. AN02str]|uniref:GldG family protein n=1 Tax=Leptolyngbya sp. AN02str TaxID=3423363 RepID=UPI003D31256E
MKALQHWKSWKTLYWVGPFLLVMGISSGLVLGRWNWLPLSLLGLGLLIVLAWLFTQTQGLKSVLSQRSAQDRTNAIITTVAVLAIFLLANALGDRLNHRFDLTENRVFTLAPQTVEVVQSLEQPVTFYVFDAAPNNQDRDLLENYRRRNPQQFRYRYIDPQVEPGIAQRFGVQNFGEVHLELGDRRQLVQSVSPEERLSERRLTNALANITSDRQAAVYFIQGHGERQLDPGQDSLSQTVTNLEDERFTVAPLNLAETPQVPNDAAVVVLAGPQRALSTEELEALRQYQQRQSGLLVMVDPQTNPELTPLLQPWGVQLSDRILYSPSAGRDGVNTVITQYGSHPITQELGNGITVYPLARPLEITPVEGIQAIPLLITGGDTQAWQVDAEGRLSPDTNNAPAGEMALGAAFSRSVDDAETDPSAEADAASEPEAILPEARMVVIGNSSFVSDGLVNQYFNRDVLLNAINWLSQADGQTFSVRPAEQTNRRIRLSPAQQIWLTLCSLALLPLAGFAMAVALWWRRR